MLQGSGSTILVPEISDSKTPSQMYFAKVYCATVSIWNILFQKKKQTNKLWYFRRKKKKGFDGIGDLFLIKKKKKTIQS